MALPPRVRDKEVMPEPCQIVRGTTGNGGDQVTGQSGSRSQSTAGQRVSHAQRTQASQAESASSILVTRSRMKPQVSGLGFVCCLDHFEGSMPSACPKLRGRAHRRGARGYFLTAHQAMISNGETHFL